MRSNMFMNQTEVAEPLECPKCGKRALIQQSINKYHCLWCRFQRDISEPDTEGVLSYVVQAIALCFTLLLVLIIAEERSLKNSPAPTSQVPTSQVPTSQVPTSQVPTSQVPELDKATSNKSAQSGANLTLGNN